MRESFSSDSLLLSPRVFVLQNFVPNHQDLMRALVEQVNWDNRMKARMTASFGKAYNYSGISYLEQDMLPCLLDITDSLCATFGHRPTNCLINYYLDGNSSLGFHSDMVDHLEQDSGISIISLGSTRVIVFRSTRERERSVEFTLEGGSLLQMDQETQIYWMHSIPKQPITGERMSLTFRCME